MNATKKTSRAFVGYFMNYHLRISDATITLGHSPKIKAHEKMPEADWDVTLADYLVHDLDVWKKYVEEHLYFLITRGENSTVLSTSQKSTTARSRTGRRSIFATSIYGGRAYDRAD